MNQVVIVLGFVLALSAGMADAGQSASPAGASRSPDAAPAPVPPAVIAREGGRVTMRAVRLTTPLRIDGKLDEGAYSEVPAASDLIQNEPRENEPASEKTDVWVFFDDDNVYVTCRCWETYPERIIANEMRRDNTNIVQNDQFAFSFDTFSDRRNAFLFEVGAAGGRIDGQITNERQISLDWNPVWNAKVGRFEGGWTVEAAIPFKSLRYHPGASQTWGFQVRRTNKWRNEHSYLAAVPASVGAQGHFRSSMFAALVGIEAPGGAKNLEIKPYLISDLTTDHAATPRISNDLGGDAGVDVKYGITQSLTADFTYNTDFAQVEADEQQVNLTRFNLFFPEKREFFLENIGTYGFGGNNAFDGAGDTPTVFYSRQIGLSQGREAPIQGGARVTGRVGRFSLGVLNVQAEAEPLAGAPAANFSVVRVKRDILRKSSVGAIFTGRSASQTAPGSNEVYGVDGTFSFFDDLAINAYWARSQTATIASDDLSYRAQLEYSGDRYGLQTNYLVVGAGFNPEIGFARRRDIVKNYVQARFSPRLPSSKRIRKLSWTGSFNDIRTGDGRLDTRVGEGQFQIQFNNSDSFTATITDSAEFLPAPFRIGGEVVLPVGDYDYTNARLAFNFGRQRTLSGNISADYGSFYSGHRKTISATSARMSLGPQLSIEPGITLNWIDLVEGSFTTKLLTSRVSYTLTPLAFVSALLQYSSGSNSVAANVRFRWEYQPGSELFVVFNEQRDTLARAFPDLASRAVIVKVNRLFRF